MVYSPNPAKSLDKVAGDKVNSRGCKYIVVRQIQFICLVHECNGEQDEKWVIMYMFPVLLLMW